jgi:hypothetical protein
MAGIMANKIENDQKKKKPGISPGLWLTIHCEFFT